MSLRERHRARTFREIHEAAWELTQRGGYGATTVEAIAERAGVSRRTFFNYFPSKEDAVLGLKPVHMPQEDVERYRDPANGDEFSRTVRLFLAILRHSSSFSATGKERKELLAANPELSRKIGLHIMTAESLVATTIGEHPGGTASTRSCETSQAYVLMAGSVLKYVYRNNEDLTINCDPDVLDRAVEQALSVFRSAFKEIS
ncbi:MULTISPECIES: TetR/AcrR family transcriptional regulator [Kocuria]|uniref:HTH tetR-type domain-containing protein n=1 Tax=Kocuria gwangalliensis TaxID=501592 RepID=A0ABP8X0J7_9MICC|nr:TetR/AcrR family transcriptional regulator [Kocuria sp.]MDO5366682.1 TetR family transcriptional regulator [Kocuria sp.]